MYIPIILNIMNTNNIDTLIHYLIISYPCYKNNWPMITLEEFRDYQKRYPDRNEYAPWVAERFSFELLSEDQQMKIDHYYISSDILKPLIDEKMSWAEAFQFLMVNPYPPLEQLLDSFLHQIMKKSKEAIEGIIVFADCYQCIVNLADKHNIQLITIEVGQIRTPVYRRMTGMLCRGLIFGNNDCKLRYDAFLQEHAGIPCPTNKELLALFLSDQFLTYIKYYDNKPKYEIGIGGNASSTAQTLYTRLQYTDEYLTKYILEQYPNDEVIFRPHPGSKHSDFYGCKNIDSVTNNIPFLLSCARIAVVSSGLGIDAMLWNRIICSRTELMPHAFQCRKDFTSLQKPDNKFVNWYLFAYLVPFELLLNPEFLRSRLDCKSETALYLEGLSRYLSELGLSLDQLNSSDTLALILKARGLPPEDIDWICNGSDNPASDVPELPLDSVSFAYAAGENGAGSTSYILCRNRVNDDQTITSTIKAHANTKQIFFEPCQRRSISMQIIDCSAPDIQLTLTHAIPTINPRTLNFFTLPPKFTISCHGEIKEGTEIYVKWYTMSTDEASHMHHAYEVLSTSHTALAERYKQLELSHQSLSETYHELETSHHKLLETYHELELAHHRLLGMYNDIILEYDKISNAFEHFKEEHNTLPTDN